MLNVFVDDPINGMKWAVVFLVIIGGFVVNIKIMKKISYVLQGQKKVDEAIEKGHVIQAKCVSSRKEYESLEKRHSGKTKHFASYEYEVNGEKRIYNGYFRHRIPPNKITLYYKDNPRKVFCIEDYQWSPCAGVIYLFFVMMPFVLAAIIAVALGIPLYERDTRVQDSHTEEIIMDGATKEGSLTHNGITVYFETPEIGSGGGEYDWLTYYVDEKESLDLKVEFGFLDELPSVPEGSRREECQLWGKEMLYETTYVPFEDEYGDVRQQEQFLAYWQLANDTYFIVVVNGVNEELSNAHSQLINDEKFQNSFKIYSSVGK